MGRPFVIDRDPIPGVWYYHCRFCQTQIARRDNENKNFIYLIEVNVLIDGPECHRMEGGVRVANVHCTKCNAPLGLKLIQEHNNNGPVTVGIFKLHLNNLFGKFGNEVHRYPEQPQRYKICTARRDQG